MTKIRVYYEEQPGLDDLELVPMKLIIQFPRGKIDWSKQTVYIPLQAPFDRQHSEDFIEDIMSVTIVFEDLLMNLERPNHFGISIKSLFKRLEKMKQANTLHFEVKEIEQFIIQINDLEELLRMDVKRIYEWR